MISSDEVAVPIDCSPSYSIDKILLELLRSTKSDGVSLPPGVDNPSIDDVLYGVCGVLGLEEEYRDVLGGRFVLIL